MITRFSPLERLRPFDRFEKMMEEMMGERDLAWIPVVDIKETDKELTFIADLPGIEEKDIDVELSGDLLTIRGKRDFASKEKREDYVRIERNFGTFLRSFRLDGQVDPDQVAANFHNGVLTVKVPKKESIQAKKVLVKHE